MLATQENGYPARRTCLNLFFYCLWSRLSGESPFQGNNDAETFALVTAASFEFDPESFEDISDEAKDFISSLLKKDQRLVCLMFSNDHMFS